MAGNRQHGFMRGNASGRNGSGVAKAFYCTACDKTHSATVEKVGISETGEIICNKQYLKMMDIKFDVQNKKVAGYKQLLNLKGSVMSDSVEGFKARVAFVKCAFEHDLVKELSSGSNSRHFSSCFEMNDADKVTAEVIRASRDSYWLRYSLIKNLGQQLFKYWEESTITH
ncbi:hypothetical protein HNW13_017560 [Shewanella sp. BF02_Schw]|uniref:hypothetical protein n=1 Tax=Shewanella sp. BF02_Schw TaxID=394908 RepID=UPI00177C895E|nr:hypothetical protein [Shewanella sp. BF02_Schw]MBO1897547.1 hypothetical protein [Shewanella sp. BF02_Schw]